jgi:NDP-sugar pyrophosphorylase family protein
MSERPIAAMVLAAGRGQRMRPLSDVIPKPALILPGGPLVGWPINLAATIAGSVVVNTWHLARQMEATVAGIGCPTRVLVSREPQLMGTAGGLALARDRGLLAGDGPVLVLNGDSVLKLDLQPLLERHLKGDDLVTLALLPHLDPTAWSRVLLDSYGNVSQILPRGAPAPGEVPFLYPGAMLVTRSLLGTLAVTPGETMERLWQPAMAKNRLGGAVVSGYWREVGSPQAYLEAALVQLNGRADVAAGAEVADRADIRVAMIGDGVRIEPGAAVADSVIGAGVRVCRGARVIRSVLLGKVEAGPGEVVADSFLAA